MEAAFRKSGSRYTLSFERRLAHSPEKVWRVLTERELLKQWFPCDVVGEWETGAELQFVFLNGEGDGLSDDELRGEVLSVEPPRLLEFRWGKNFIRCELIAEENGCKFLFSDTFDDPSTGARSAAGWEMCLENMDVLLEGGAVAKFAWDVWQEKFDHYVEKFTAKFGAQQGAPENQ